mmetsp:Transcript_57390/g.64164  ORF Transcript_57390/g.64164 Transcript_57390/m.64164 type:complete len:139 (-) Transcript_57390:34-450(-)
MYQHNVGSSIEFRQIFRIFLALTRTPLRVFIHQRTGCRTDVLHVFDSTVSSATSGTASSDEIGFLMDPTDTIQGKWIRSWFVIVPFGDQPIDRGLATSFPATLRSRLGDDQFVPLFQPIHRQWLGCSTHDDDRVVRGC